MFYPSCLYLNDRVVYKGWSFFDCFISRGEVVFNTGMTGYQEVITDPSYSGQIVIFTYPEIGNTGLNGFDNESNIISVKGIIAKKLCFDSSNWRSDILLKDYIIKKQIPHIFGIDTRSLVKYIRSHGVMNGCMISKSYLTKFLDLSLTRNIDFVKRVTTKQSYYIHSLNLRQQILHYFDQYNNNIGQYKNINLNIVVLDFGIKFNMINRLLFYNCNVNILPATSTYEEIRSFYPDGILLSNGPGDPSLLDYAINTVQKLILFSNIPIFGICMGHQILSLALDANTFKLKFGHRGLNHPVGINQQSKITSQNHGFSVCFDSINNLCDTCHILEMNLNDHTIAGMCMNNKPIFSVQYHPEASPGPRDADYLFNLFIKLITVFKGLKNLRTI